MIHATGERVTMRCVHVLSYLALKLCVDQQVGRNGWTTVADTFAQFDHHVARALRQANVRAWIAVEVLLAGEPLWERAQLTWERNLEAEFFRPLRLLLDEVSLGPLEEGGPNARRNAQQSLHAALGSGLLTSGSLEVAELLLAMEDAADPDIDDGAWQWQYLNQLMDQLEGAGYPELKPLFRLRCATGEPFLVSLVAAVFRHAVVTDPDLFGELGEACTETPAEGVIKDLSGLVGILDRHRARLHALLSSLHEPQKGPPIAPVLDAVAGANRLERGLTFSRRGEFEQAIAEFTAALRLDPASVLALLNRADSYRLKGEYVRALADYSTALRQDPSHVQALIQRGQVHWMMGHVQAAIGDFSAVLQIDPKNAVAYHYRGKALNAVGDHDAAIINLSEALRLDPYYAWAYHDSGDARAAKGNHERAIADYSEAIRLNPLTTLTYLRRGDVHAAQKEYDRAIADYGNALRLDPHNAAGYQSRGVAFRELGKYEEAAAEFTRALELDFSNGQSYFERGLLFLLQGQHQRAVHDFNAAASRLPQDAEVFFRRGQAYQTLGKAKGALTDFSQALRLDPQHAEAYHSRGLLYAARAENDVALPDFNEVVRLKPRLTKAYLSRAKCLFALGDWQEALADCDQVLQLDPAIAHASFIRGSILAQKGDFAQAIDDFTRALHTDTANAQGFYLRGVAYLKMENFRQAVLDLTEAIRLDPNHARSYAQRAAIRQAAGLPELALADLAHATRLDAKLAPAYCRQLAVVHSAMGLHECAVADYALALLLDPNNASALAGREQAWKVYQAQPPKKQATSKTMRQMGGKFPPLLESSAVASSQSAAQPAKTAATKKTHMPAQTDEKSTIPIKSTRVHRLAVETALEIAAIGSDTTEEENAISVGVPQEMADEEHVEIEILDDGQAEVAEPEASFTDAPAANDAAAATPAPDEPAPDEVVGSEEAVRKAQEEAAHRARLLEEYRKAEDERKKKLEAKGLPTKKKEAKKHNDDEDDEGLSLWKKGTLAAASVFLVYVLGSTAWGFFDEMGRTGKPKTVSQSGKLVSAHGDVPLGNVDITFEPKTPSGLPAHAATKPDGTFKVGTFGENDGIVAGSYIVILEPQRMAGGFVAREYQSSKTSPLTIEVTSSSPSELPTIKVK